MKVPESKLERFDSQMYGSLTVFRDEDGHEFYRAIDVCTALRLSNASQSLSRYVDEDYIVQVADGSNRAGKVNYVSEPGLYQLLFSSKTEWAKSFQKWVFEDVLPKIRAQSMAGLNSLAKMQYGNNLDSLLSFDPIEVHWGNYEEAIQTIAAIREISRPLKIADRHIRDKFVQFARRERMDDFQTEDGWAYQNRPRVHFFLEPDRDICDIDLSLTSRELNQPLLREMTDADIPIDGIFPVSSPCFYLTQRLATSAKLAPPRSRKFLLSAQRF